MGNEPRTSPSQRRKLPSQGKNWSWQRLQKLLCSSRNIQKFLSQRNQPSRLMLWVSLPLQLSGLMLWVPLCLSNATVSHPGKQRNPSKGLNLNAHQPLTQISLATGSRPMSRRAERYPTGVVVLGHLPPGCWAPQQHASPIPSQQADCSI